MSAHSVLYRSLKVTGTQEHEEGCMFQRVGMPMTFLYVMDKMSLSEITFPILCTSFRYLKFNWPTTVASQLSSPFFFCEVDPTSVFS